MNDDAEKVTGVIFPAPKEVIDRMLDEDKDVFVKYMAHEVTKKSKLRLRKGIRLFLYQSKSEKKVVAEAVVDNVRYLTFNEILNNYEDRAMLSTKDLKEYAKGREDRRAWVLVLSKLRRYEKAKSLRLPLTMNGVYITDSNKEEIFE